MTKVIQFNNKSDNVYSGKTMHGLEDWRSTLPYKQQGEGRDAERALLEGFWASTRLIEQLEAATWIQAIID